jgi:hypothetical protein
MDNICSEEDKIPARITDKLISLSCDLEEFMDFFWRHSSPSPPMSEMVAVHLTSILRQKSETPLP